AAPCRAPDSLQSDRSFRAGTPFGSGGTRNTCHRTLSCMTIVAEVMNRNATPMANETFPIDLSKLQPLKLDPAVSTLTDAQKATLKHNIQLCRDTIVFFTALAGA